VFFDCQNQAMPTLFVVNINTVLTLASVYYVRYRPVHMTNESLAQGNLNCIESVVYFFTCIHTAFL